MNDGPTVLDSIGTKELIDEILRRCKPAIFIGAKTDDNGTCFTFWSYSGNRRACYGMLHEIGLIIQRDENKEAVKEALDDSQE